MATDGKKSKLKLSPRYWLEDVKAKDDWKNAAGKTITQAVIGVGGGTIVTAVVGGKISFGAGALLLGLGNYKDLALLKPLGIGMMAASLMMGVEQVLAGPGEAEGFDWKTEKEKAKQRLLSLKDTFLSRTYLDKVFKKKEEKKGGGKSQRKVEPVEERPEDVNGLESPDTELENIERQLVAAAAEFQKKQQSKQVEGVDPELMGLEEEVDFARM